MAAPVVYRSTDASAPTLSGTAGDLTNLLNKCLVSGYGSGAQAAGAGWTEVVNTNAGQKRVFRMGAGNQRYLWVDDSAPVIAAEAHARGWESHDSVASTDSTDYTVNRYGPFPNATQFANGLVIGKSATSNATTRPWIVVADSRTFYLFVKAGYAGDVNAYTGFMFGDTYSYSLGGDAYSTAIIGRTTDNSASLAGVEVLAQLVASGGVAVAGSNGHYLCRSVFGTVASPQFSKFGDMSKMLTTGGTAGQVEVMRGGIPYTNGPDGKLYLWPVEISDGLAVGVRGRLRGLYHQCHAIASFNDGDTFSGAASTDYAGKTFLVIKTTGQGLVGASGVYVIETTAWDTN